MKNKTKQSKSVGLQIGGATLQPPYMCQNEPILTRYSARDAIIDIVQNWFKSGAVVHLPGVGTIRASDVNETVLVPKGDGSIECNLTFDCRA